MAGARWTTLAVVGTIAVLVAGCGGSTRVQVKRLAIALPGKSTEIGWNQQGAVGARRAARALEIQAQVAEGLGEGDVKAALKRLAKGAQLVVAHGRRYGAAATAVADETHVPELVFDSPERLRAGRVGDIEVATEEAGYLAGYISARASFVRSVGIVLAGDDPLWYRTTGGFIAGARKFDPHVRIGYTRVAGGENERAQSQAAAKALTLRGHQMILGLGERSTYGVMAAAENALNAVGQRKFDVMFVDVIGDKSGAGHLSITGLTAVMWNFAPAYEQAVRDLAAGTFGKHPYKLDLANGGVSVIADGRTPMDNYGIALGLGRQIAHGQLKVPVTTTNAAVEALLAQK